MCAETCLKSHNVTADTKHVCYLEGVQQVLQGLYFLGAAMRVPIKINTFYVNGNMCVEVI